MDTSDLASNQSARLISTMTTVTSRGTCFRFWYRAYGSRLGRLNLLQRASNEQNTTIVFTTRGDQELDWREAIVYRPTTGNYQFILEGQVGNVVAGSDNIAIDDITTNEGTDSHRDVREPCPIHFA